MGKFVIVYIIIIMHVQIIIVTYYSGWKRNSYLDAWEKSVEAREGFTKTLKN